MAEPENSVNHDQDDQEDQHNLLSSLVDERPETLLFFVHYPAKKRERERENKFEVL